MENSLKRKRVVSDVEIYLNIPKCFTGYELIRELKLDKSGKTYARIKRIKEKYNVKFKTNGSG